MAPARVPRRGVPRAVRGALRLGRALRALPRAPTAVPRARPARRVGSRPWRPAADQAVLRPLRARDLDARLRWAARGRPRSRAGLRGRVAPMTSTDGPLAIVLHSHLPYVEGFDTWP